MMTTKILIHSHQGIKENNYKFVKTNNSTNYIGKIDSSKEAQETIKEIARSNPGCIDDIFKAMVFLQNFMNMGGGHLDVFSGSLTADPSARFLYQNNDIFKALSVICAHGRQYLSWLGSNKKQNWKLNSVVACLFPCIYSEFYFGSESQFNLSDANFTGRAESLISELTQIQKELVNIPDKLLPSIEAPTPPPELSSDLSMFSTTLSSNLSQTSPELTYNSGEISSDSEAEAKNEIMQSLEQLSDEKKLEVQLISKIEEINRTLTSDSKINNNEINFIILLIRRAYDGNLILDVPILYKKNKYGMRHSLLIYRTTNNEIGILVKAKVHNLDKQEMKSKDPNLKVGNTKNIKKTPVEIMVKTDFSVSVDKVITMSKSNKTQSKNKDLKAELGDALKGEGFREIEFVSNGISRVIYVDKDHGEDLNSQIKKLAPKLTQNEKREISSQMLANYEKDKDIGDIKANNVCYDARTKKVNFIDCKDRIFLFTTREAAFGGECTNFPSGSIALEQQQILGLVIIYYQIYHGLKIEGIYKKMPQLSTVFEKNHFKKLWLYDLTFRFVQTAFEHQVSYKLLLSFFDPNEQNYLLRLFNEWEPLKRLMIGIIKYDLTQSELESEASEDNEFFQRLISESRKYSYYRKLIKDPHVKNDDIKRIPLACDGPFSEELKKAYVGQLSLSELRAAVDKYYIS